MERIMSLVRKQTAAFLDTCAQVGIPIPADPPAGRHAACWMNGADEARDRRVVIELHGGGFALGDARKGDALREWVARSFGVIALGVDYRLAPAHPAPAALEDVVATIAYASERFAGADGKPPALYLMGFSAGANLAVAAALQVAGDERFDVAGMALHYPMVDASEVPQGGDDSSGLPTEVMEAFTEWYTLDLPVTDIRVSPALASDAQLATLPRTVFYPVKGDPLYPQAERLYQRMNAVGCSVSWHPVPNAYHGYIEDAENMPLYRAITMPQTIEARPADFVEAAARQMRASLEEMLGPAQSYVSFPELEGSGSR